MAAATTGQGVGRALLERLVAGADAAGIWTIQAGIFPENQASLALHRRCGFRTVGVRERLGKLGGRWRDVVLLERRSPLDGQPETVRGREARARARPAGRPRRRRRRR